MTPFTQWTSAQIADYARQSDADRAAVLGLAHSQRQEARDAKYREQFEQECG